MIEPPAFTYEVREIGRRIVRNLTRTPFRNFKDAPQGAVLVTEGLRPADAAVIDPAGRPAEFLTSASRESIRSS